MHFGLAIELSDIDLWDIDSLDTHLDSLDTNIPSKYLVCLHSVFKTSSRYALETSSRHVFKLSSRQVFRTPSRHVFKTSSRHVFKTSSRRHQRNNFSSFNTSSIRLQDVLRDVFKTSWKTKNCYAEDVLKTSSRHVLKTNKCLLGFITA